jgi:PBP1b-binding outer membrane lipoprotein LpoB
MNTKNIASLAAAALLLAACVSADLGEPGKPHAEKQYRTGSNIPRRADQMPDSVETARSPLDGSMGHGGSVPMPGAGGH